MSESPTQPGKNIVVLSDGTGKEGGLGNETNVYKLFRMLENRTPHQIVFYFITGNAFGMGFAHNVRECYRFIFDHFQAGDRIYLFGFSRGAFTVRSLSGFIHWFGVLPKSRPELIKRAWDIYKTRNVEKRKLKADDFIGRHHTTWTKIECLGVWDTVAALGFPYRRVAAVLDRIPWFRHKFHDHLLSDSVLNGFQALAIDDCRQTFHPILWQEPEPRVQQVWFSDMHSDVGGGYAETDLSNIVLQWMVRHATAKGLRLYSRHEVKGHSDPTGVLHDSRSGWGGMYRRKQRTWPFPSRPTVHVSAVERNRILGSEYSPWIMEDGEFDIALDVSNESVFA